MARRLPCARGDWLRIVAVGSARLVLEAEDGALYACDGKGGRSTALPEGATGVSIDPVTDDVVSTADGRALRWSPARPGAESFALR